jgi:hypothetical protein
LIYDNIVEIATGRGADIKINCEARLFKIGSWTILRLPESASAKLPSRGRVMIEGTIKGFGFQTPLEPDGK